MHGKYTANKIALATSGLVGIILIIMLFTPPYMGIADDGTLYKVMNRNGLSYIENNPEDIYNNYFIKIYFIDKNATSQSTMNGSHDLFVKAAILLDNFVTGDQYFDIRFLAFIYSILFLPVIYIIVKHTCLRIENFSEAAAIGVLAIVIFGDISFLSYFNSLYPEALWIIGALYCIAAIIRLQDKNNSYLSLLLLGVFGIIFCTTRQQCGVIGFILSGFSIRAIFLNKQLVWKTCCVLLSFTLSITGIVTIFRMESDFTIDSKHHAMTRGVLFQAENPEVALREFGINPSYSVLANTSTYNFYPFVKAGNQQLQDNFYNKYNSTDIVLYYLRHPVSFFRMLDVAVKSTTNLRRNFCGNYEKSAGMPKMAQGLFWSGWSNLKDRSAPKTIGYLILLILLSYIVNKRRTRSRAIIREGQGINLLFNITVVIAAIGLSQAAISIVLSGDAELTQHAFLLGAALDLIVFFLVAKALPSLNILQDGVERIEK
jgi:hypothetical protein